MTQIMMPWLELFNMHYFLKMQLNSIMEAQFIWRTLVPGCGVTQHSLQPKLPRVSQLFLNFLTKIGCHSHMKQEVGSVRSMTRLIGLPFFDCRITLLAGPTLLHINTFMARPVGSYSRVNSVNQRMRKHCLLKQRGTLVEIWLYQKCCDLLQCRLSLTSSPKIFQNIFSYL